LKVHLLILACFMSDSTS